MISDHLSSIDGVTIYPIISLILFFAMFAFTLIWVIKLDKKYIHRMENIPLDISPVNENNSEIENETNE